MCSTLPCPDYAGARSSAPSKLEGHPGIDALMGRSGPTAYASRVHQPTFLFTSSGELM